MYGIKYIKSVQSKYRDSEIEIYQTEQGYEIKGNAQLPHITGVKEENLDAEIERMDKITTEFVKAIRAGDLNKAREIQKSLM